MLKIIALGAIIKPRATVRIFKTRFFAKWARKVRLSDRQLRQVVEEMGLGLVEANLGGHVYKKRVPLQGRGKRGSARAVVVYKKADKVFFVLGFAKNEKANLSTDELHSVRALATEFLSYADAQLDKLIKVGELIEVIEDE